MKKAYLSLMLKFILQKLKIGIMDRYSIIIQLKWSDKSHEKP